MESRGRQCFEVLEKIRIFVVCHKRSDMKYTFLRYAIGPISLLALTLIIMACNRQREAKETWEPEMGVVDSGVIPPQSAPDILPTPDSVVPRHHRKSPFHHHCCLKTIHPPRKKPSHHPYLRP